MNVLAFRRQTGPSDRPAGSRFVVVTAVLAPGNYLIHAGTFISIPLGESSCQLQAYPTGGGGIIDLDSSTASYINSTKHSLQRAIALPAGATLRLSVWGSKPWSASHSSVIAIKADSVTEKQVTS